MRDNMTGRSRGFAFLNFVDPKAVNTVMVREHYLDGKVVSLLHKLVSSALDETSLLISVFVFSFHVGRLIPNEQFLDLSTTSKVVDTITITTMAAEAEVVVEATPLPAKSSSWAVYRLA